MGSTLVFDIDGTLINSEKRVLPESIDILKKLQRTQRTRVVLASARAPKSIEIVRSQIDIECGVVAFNGALCFEHGDLDRGRVARISTPIGFSEVSFALDIVQGIDLTISLFSQDAWFANRDDYWLRREIRGTGLNPDMIDEDCLLKLAKKEAVYKLMFRGTEISVAQALNRLNASSLPKMANIFSDRPTIVEISPVAASKYHGVLSLIDPDSKRNLDVLVFGDADNDLEMITEFSNSVAMGNGSPAVKKAARFVIEDNNEPGIAKFLASWYDKN